MNSEQILREVIHAAIDAVRPEIFMPNFIRVSGDQMKIREDTFHLRDYARIYVVSVGKAAVGMAEALDALMHSYITEGIVLTKHIPEKTALDDHYQILQGGHPVPSEGSVKGAKAILTLLDRTGPEDLVIFLISGGGSALMTAPVLGISLDMMQDFSRAILSCGADISEFNTLRKHLDEVKGGGLAMHAAPAHQITVILSDVVGSPLEIIASGPTVPDPSTYADALAILDRYSAHTAFPPEIRKIFTEGVQGKRPETLKEKDEIFSSAKIYLAAENKTAASAAAEKARELGIESRVIRLDITGEASEVGTELPADFSETESPMLYVFGGETTVHIHGNGLGGRNLEMALAAVRPMAEYPGCTFATLATDGEDGPTDAAGAIVTSETLSKALSLGCVPEAYLEENDSYHFFETVGGLLKPGPTGTNVNDLTFLLRL